MRQAVVSAPICGGLPRTNARGALSGILSGLVFGASCSLGNGLCRSVATVSCTAENAPDLWVHVAPLMPANATPANLTLTYAFDPTLGFLGGPYTPNVTAEITDLRFAFVTPLGALARLAGVGDPGTVGDPLTFPSISASLPAEALLIGDDTCLRLLPTHSPLHTRRRSRPACW